MSSPAAFVRVLQERTLADRLVTLNAPDWRVFVEHLEAVQALPNLQTLQVGDQLTLTRADNLQLTRLTTHQHAASDLPELLQALPRGIELHVELVSPFPRFRTQVEALVADMPRVRIRAYDLLTEEELAYLRQRHGDV